MWCGIRIGVLIFRGFLDTEARGGCGSKLEGRAAEKL